MLKRSLSVPLIDEWLFVWILRFFFYAAFKNGYLFFFFLKWYLQMKSCSFSASLQLKVNQTHKLDRRENSIRLNRDIDCWRKRNHREKDQEWGRGKKTESTLRSTNRGNNNRLRQLRDKNEMWNRGLIGMKMRWHKWDREGERWYAIPWQHKGCHTCSSINSSAIFLIEPCSWGIPHHMPVPFTYGFHMQALLGL